jgi:HEAT repeat protein
MHAATVLPASGSGAGRRRARLVLAGIFLLSLSAGSSAVDDGDTSRLIAAMHDRDWQVRREAALQLGAVPRAGSDIVVALRDGLADDDSRVRRSAATALGNIGSAAARATPALIVALDDRDAAVVQAAAVALGRVGRKASRADDALEQLLGSTNPDTRLAAGEALARMDRAKATSSQALVALLADPDAQTRADAAHALGQIDGDDNDVAMYLALTKRLADDDADARRAAADALGALGRPAVPWIIRSLSEANPVVLQATVDALANVGDAAVPALIETLEDPSRPLLARQYAAKALARIGNGKGRVLPALVKRLDDKEPGIRVAAIEALGNLGPEAATATPDLLAVMNDRDEDVLVREYAINAAARVAPGSQELDALLVEAVADTNARISEAAVAALVRIRSGADNTAAVAASMADLQSADTAHRLAAVERLAMLGPYAKDAVPALAAIVETEANDPALRAAAARALGMVGPAAEPALPALNAALHGTDPAVNDAALVAIQRIGPPSNTIPALMAALKDSDLGVRGSAAVSIRNFASARLEGWKPLLAQSDAPVMRAWLSRHETLYGVAATATERPGTRHPQAGTDYFDVLGGRAAVRESMQLQSLVSAPVAADDERPTPIDEIDGIDVPSHPFAKLLKDSDKPAQTLPLADFAPPDRLFAYFRDPAALRDFVDGGGDLFMRLDSAFSLKTFDYHLAARYLARLGLGGSNLAQLEGLDSIGEIAIVAPDVFFIDGTDLTAIVRIRQSGPIGAILDLADLDATDVRAIQPKNAAPGATVFAARRGDLLFVGSSEIELRYVLSHHDNRNRASLGRSDEFRYMLQQLPLDERTQAYVYASDPFMRRLIGPDVKIAQLRRARARAELETLTAAALLFKLDGNTAAPTKTRLIELGYAPLRLDTADYSIDANLVSRSTQYGSSAALEPLGANPVTEVTKAEAAAYRSYADNYAAYWRQFFDPIAFRLDAMDENTWELSTFILPLLDSALYDTVRNAVTRAGSGLHLRVPTLSPTPTLLFSVNLSDSMRLTLVDMLTGVLEQFTTVDPAIFDAFTPTLHVAVQDSTPIVAVGSGDVLGAFSEKLLQMQGFEPFLPIALSLLSQPSSVLIELADPDAVLEFLRGASSGQGRGGEEKGTFHRIKGEDTWIYSVNVFDMVQLHLRVAVENDYLVISNLPWSSKATLAGTTEEPLNGARLELNLAAITQQLPALHTRSYSDYRIAAVDGMGYLYPLLASGMANTVGEALDDHLAVFGFAPVHPGAGEWLWDSGTISSSVFGTPDSPVQPAYVPGDRDFGLFPTLDSVSVSAQLEDTGLRTRIRWRRIAP